MNLGIALIAFLVFAMTILIAVGRGDFDGGACQYVVAKEEKIGAE